MSTRTEQDLTTAASFLENPADAVMGPGVQIDWSAVPNTYIPAGKTYKVLPAGTILKELASGYHAPHDSATAGTINGRLLRYKTVENAPQDALSGYGTVIGGIVVRTRIAGLTTLIEDEIKAAGAAFYFRDAPRDSNFP